jgi:hypothetical protein
MPAKLRIRRSLTFALGFFLLSSAISLVAQQIPEGTTIVVRNDTALSSATGRGAIGPAPWSTTSRSGDDSLAGRVPRCEAELLTPNPPVG